MWFLGDSVICMFLSGWCRRHSEHWVGHWGVPAKHLLWYTVNICSVSEGNNKRFLSDYLHSFMWMQYCQCIYLCYVLLLVWEMELSTHPSPMDMDIDIKELQIQQHRCAVLQYSTLQMTQQLSNPNPRIGVKEQVVVSIGYLHWLQYSHWKCWKWKWHIQYEQRTILKTRLWEQICLKKWKFEPCPWWSGVSKLHAF